MGIVISYIGSVRDEAAYEAVMQIATAFANAHGWPYWPLGELHAIPGEPEGSAPWRYEGLNRGLELSPHPKSEPVMLDFDAELHCENCVKTQFAGPDTHKQVIELLSELQPHFISLEVNDEAGYWDERNQSALRETFAEWEAAIVQANKELTQPKPSGLKDWLRQLFR